MPGLPGEEFLPGQELRDDETIHDDTRLARRIPPGRFKNQNGRDVPNSDCFKDSSNKTGTSIDICAGDWSPEFCLRDVSSDFGLVTFTAGQLRGLGLGVVPGAIPGNPHHATIQGPKSERVRRALAAVCRWEKMPAQKRAEDI